MSPSRPDSRRAALIVLAVVLSAAIAWAVHSTADRQRQPEHSSGAEVMFVPIDEVNEQLPRGRLAKPDSCEPGKPGHCPIVVDLHGDGLELTSPAGGVWFDLDTDGTPEQIAWTRAGSRLAFLASDRNGNGRIDDGRELFGSTSPLPVDASTANGWVVLQWYDEVAGGNGDGKLSAEDQIWDDLWLWRDRNHNGLSEPDELSALEDSAAQAILLAYQEVRTVDDHGNETRYAAPIPLAARGGSEPQRAGTATEVILRESGVAAPGERPRP